MGGVETCDGEMAWPRVGEMAWPRDGGTGSMLMWQQVMQMAHWMDQSWDGMDSMDGLGGMDGMAGMEGMERMEGMDGMDGDAMDDPDVIHKLDDADDCEGTQQIPTGWQTQERRPRQSYGETQSLFCRTELYLIIGCTPDIRAKP